MKVNQVLSKLSEVSVTKLKNKLLRDRFFRTESVIVVSLCILCLANIVIVGVASHHLNLRSTALVRDVNARILASGTFVVNPEESKETLHRELSHLRNTTLVMVGTAVIIITLVLGFFIARMALRPTREALSSQKQFIANIAHELRTPLSIIKANNEVLQLESPDNNEIMSMTNSNLEELDRVSGIINNLLTLNAFHDREEQEFKPVNISYVLHEVLNQLSQMIKEKRQEVGYDIESNLLVIGNQSALVQIFTNLVKNASTYTPEGGTLDIRAEMEDEHYVVVAVTDSGIGIEASKLNNIFQPFYQIDSSRSNEKGSHGLGLAIVSELVKIHKGRISVRSTPNIGTTIRVWLPATNHTSAKKELAKTLRSKEVHLDFSQNGS